MYRPRRPQEYLPADEIYHTYTLIVWQGVCAVFHSGLLNFGDLESVLFLYAFNLITLSLAFSPNALKLEPYVMIGRIIGSLAFLDLRHGLCINVLFKARRLHFLFGTFSISDGLMIFVQEVCVTTCVLLIPWAIEVIARQWISLMLSASDLETALQAARTVIASAADAQGELDKDLKLMQVSPKLAHLFQAKTEELEGRSFLELLAEDDHERFQNDLEIHICSMPKERRRGPQFFFAITEVREKLNDGDEGELEAEKVLAKNGTAPRDGEPPRLTAEALATHSWATPVPNCSSLWEVKVLLDEASLEVHEINLTLNTNHWKKSRKTFLKECILPGAWDDLKRWIQGSLKGRPGDPPFIVPFGFPRIMSAIACARNVELKRKVGSTGRNELSLRLKHIFVRRPVVPAPPPVFSFGVVLLELLTGWPAAWKGSDEEWTVRQATRWLFKEITSLSQIEAKKDKRAQWTKRAVTEVGQLTLNCVCANDEEQLFVHRPDFTDLVRLLRGLRDLPDTDDLPSSPTKKQSGKPQVFQRPLFWFMHVVWVEDRPTFPETIIEWRAAEKGFPIKVRNMTFGRTEYESALQSILSDQPLTERR
eukprot:g17718.t1